jgi:hypothetical protein
LESYYGDHEGVETVTLCIAGTGNQEDENEALFKYIIPKHDLMRSTPVFQRMFASEMTEKATGKVQIEDTTPEEFGDFLKAISPKQEHPNREFNDGIKCSYNSIIHIHTFPASNVLDLLKLSDRYHVQSLRDRCEAHLVNCIEIPLEELLTSVELYGLKNLMVFLLDLLEPNLL